MLTEEQRLCLQEWKSGKNVCVNAVCGSGKTTVLLSCASSFPEEKVLLLVYNKQLATELSSRVDSNVSCMTIHSFCSKFVSQARDDKSLSNSVGEAYKGPLFTKVMIDECQDLREVYVSLLKKCLFDKEESKKTSESSLRVFLVGDPEQTLYDYDDQFPADPSFLMQPEKVYNPHENSWSLLTLSMSFRLTNQLVSFVNEVTLPTRRIQSNGKDGPDVKVMTLTDKESVEVIRSALKEYGKDTLILTQTRKNNIRLQHVLNRLSSEFSFHIHGLDGEDERVYRSKIRVMSWHSSKGMEADSVIVFGANKLSKRMPFHVSITRSKQNLIILNEKEFPNIEVCRGVPFSISNKHTNQLHDEFYTNFTNCGRNTFTPWKVKEETGKKEGAFSALESDTQTLMFDEDRIVVECKPYCYEDVTDLYVEGAQIHVEMMTTGTCTRVERLLGPPNYVSFKDRPAYLMGQGKRRFDTTWKHLPAYLKEEVKMRYRSGKEIDLKDSMFLSIVWNSYSNGYYHNMKRLLPVHTWLDEKRLEKMTRTLQRLCDMEKKESNSKKRVREDSQEYSQDEFDTCLAGPVSQLETHQQIIYYDRLFFRGERRDVWVGSRLKEATLDLLREDAWIVMLPSCSVSGRMEETFP